jgi:prepilin-type N-terminal cleavage/methylation domain-containing protein
MNLTTPVSLWSRRGVRKNAGFSLLELMIAMTVFLVIGGAAMTLFRQNTDLFTDQQGTTALNITMRNALTQIQNDVVNAANGYSQIGPTVGWPFGISVTNVNPGFDTLNVMVPAVSPAALPNATCIDTTTGVGTIVPAAGTTAASYPVNGEVLFLNNTGNQFTTGKITGAATVGANISLWFTKTNADGTNSVANDPLNVTTKAMPAGSTDQLGTSFCTGSNVVLLGTTTYTVNGTNQLTRQVGAAGAIDTIADQIIGFKVGVSQFNNVGVTSGQYFYDNSFTTRAIRSVRVSVIGRTTPGQWSGVTFANTFDGGNYKIEALSLVVNPRNLSMNDCGSCN